MSDTKYTVELELTKHGDFGLDVAVKKTGELDKGLGRVKEGWKALGSGIESLSSKIDNLASKGYELTKGFAMAGVAAAIGGVTYGVMSLNAQAEGAMISMGAIFAANGAAQSVPKGIIMAKDNIAKMRLDAQKLPGEFEDLQRIFVTGATSALQGGASIDEWRGLSAKAMAAGFVTQMPMDQVARELTALLEGHAGGQNTFGSKLGLTGDKAQSFNKLDKAGRRAQITTELDKYAGAIDIFAGSWEGLTSTMVDGLKSFGRTATGGIFERLKETLVDINNWFSKNQDAIGRFAENLGLKLVAAFDWGKKKILEWYPIVEQFAMAAFDRLSKVWETIQPYVESFASALKDALADPSGTIDKLVHLGEMFLALQVAGGVSGGIGAMGSKAGRAGAGMELAAGGIGAAALGASGWGAAGAAGASVGGGALAGSAAGPVGAALGAAAGAIGFATAATVNYMDVKKAGEDANTAATWKLAHTLWDANEAINTFAAKQGQAAETWADVSERYAQTLEASGDEAAAALFRLQQSAMDASFAMDKMYDKAGDQKTEVDIDRNSKILGLALMKTRSDDAEGKRQAAAAKKKSVGGMGGTSIQKVEIVVTANGDPSRIARVVEAHLTGLSRNRRSSPMVQAYNGRENR